MSKISSASQCYLTKVKFEIQMSNSELLITMLLLIILQCFIIITKVLLLSHFVEKNKYLDIVGQYYNGIKINFSWLTFKRKICY